MIIESDDTATIVLLKYFGIENINNYIINALNVKNTYVQRYMLDEKAIKNAINTYKIEKLDNKKAELLEKQQTPGLSKEEEIKIIEEISKIIIEKKMIK